MCLRVMLHLSFPEYTSHLVEEHCVEPEVWWYLAFEEVCDSLDDELFLVKSWAHRIGCRG
jgi:hypothetical protein